jgi:hypothetical protein
MRLYANNKCPVPHQGNLQLFALSFFRVVSRFSFVSQISGSLIALYQVSLTSAVVLMETTIYHHPLHHTHIFVFLSFFGMYRQAMLLSSDGRPLHQHRRNDRQGGQERLVQDPGRSLCVAGETCAAPPLHPTNLSLSSIPSTCNVCVCFTSS